VRLFLYEYSVVQPESAALPLSVRREGRAIFDALLTDAQKLPPNTDVVTIPQLIETAPEEDIFRETAARSDFALVVAPEFDGILEDRCRWAEESDCRLLGPNAKAVRLTADKWELYQHWLKRGVPTPMTWLPSALPANPGSFIRKHRFGAGSLDVQRVDGPNQLGSHHIVQEFIPGQPVSQALLIAASGNVIALPPTAQQISTDGTFCYQGGSLPISQHYCSRVEKLSLQAIQGIPGLKGYVGVDAILGEVEDGSQDQVLEINPRVTTSYLGLRTLAKGNLLQTMLELAQAREPQPLAWHNGPISFSADGRVQEGPSSAAGPSRRLLLSDQA
jgi:predicted ATP-grasp superfamily ATP-dependent carboligase